MTKVSGHYCEWPSEEGSTSFCGRTDPALFDDDGAWSHRRCSEHKALARKLSQLAKEKRSKARIMTCDSRDIEMLGKLWVYGQKTAEGRYIEWRQNR